MSKRSLIFLLHVVICVFFFGTAMTVHAQKSPYSIATAEIQNILEHLGHRPITRNKLQLELYEGLLKFYCSLTYDCLLHPSKTAKL